MLGGTVHPVASHQVMPATLVPKDSRRHFITCKFCQPSKLFLPMPLSDERQSSGSEIVFDFKV
jgi:hypothetical protein